MVEKSKKENSKDSIKNFDKHNENSKHYDESSKTNLGSQNNSNFRKYDNNELKKNSNEVDKKFKQQTENPLNKENEEKSNYLTNKLSISKIENFSLRSTQLTNINSKESEQLEMNFLFQDKFNNLV